MQKSRGIFAGVGVIAVAVVVTVAIFSIGLNGRCQSRFWDHLQVYPGAERVDQVAEFLGVQRAIYHSADTPEVIDSWYATQHTKQTRAAVTSGSFATLPLDNWVVDADAQHGGSRITFAAVCP